MTILFQKMEVAIECSASDGYFAEDLTDAEVIEELKRNGPIPCEGAGIGLHCEGCRFCAAFEVTAAEGNGGE